MNRPAATPPEMFLLVCLDFVPPSRRTRLTAFASNPQGRDGKEERLGLLIACRASCRLRPSQQSRGDQDRGSVASLDGELCGNGQQAGRRRGEQAERSGSYRREEGGNGGHAPQALGRQRGTVATAAEA